MDNFEEIKARLKEPWVEAAGPNHPYVRDVTRLLAEVESLRQQLAQVKGCQCVCHSFPEHGKLQDALEANQFHLKQLAEITLRREETVMANEHLTERLAQVMEALEAVKKDLEDSTTDGVQNWYWLESDVRDKVAKALVGKE